MSSSKYSSNPLKYRPYLQHQPSSFPQKPPLPKSSLLSSHITSAFSQQEEELFKLSLKLYDELFPHILQINENEFLHKLESIILLSLKRNITFPSGTISKIINIIKTNHYEKDYVHINKLIQSIDNMNKYQKLPGNYIIPHCNQMNVSKHPQHPCGEQLYFLTQDLLLCLKCQLIYSVSSVYLHCTHCDEDFYTSVDPDFHKAKYSKATWNKYHCKVLFNEPMKCHQCRDYLHINNTNNKLTCLACNYEIESNNLKSKCVVCGSEFTSEAKRFNKQEKKVVNVVINETLYNKIEAKPPSVPCCGNKLKDLSQYVFTHKKECNGVLYEGKLHQKDIVVCSKCRMLNFKDNHHWMCPLCKERFKLGGDTVAPHNKEYHKVDIPQFKKLNINNDNDDNDNGSKFFIKRANTNFIHGDYSNPRTSRESTAVMENERKKYGYSRNSPSTEENYLRRMNSHTNNKADAIHTQENEIEKNIVLSHARHASNQVMERSNRNRLQGPVRQRSMQFDKEETSEFHNATATSSFKNSFMKGGTPFKNARINLPIYQQHQPQQSSNMFGKLEFNLNNINININVNPDTLSKATEPKQQQCNTFSIDDYTIQKQIGEGTFGKIYEVTDSSGKRYALKKILTSSNKEISGLTSEYEIIRSFSNTKLNLVKIYGMETKQLDKTTHVMYVLMDLALRDWEKEINIRRSKNMFYTENELLQILKQLVITFAELQRRNISHRDIKPQNILLFPDNTFRISDFGEAKEILSSNKNDKNNTIKQTIRGTELYMSPILFKALKEKGIDEKYTEHNSYKSDVFSLGLCLLLGATLTFNALIDIRELEDMINMKMKLTKYLKGRYTSKFLDILYSMLEMNEKMRHDFIELEKYVERL